MTRAKARMRVHTVDTTRFQGLGGVIVHTTKGPALRLERPHHVLHLSANAAAVFEVLPASEGEIAERTALPVASVRAILDTFEIRGLVTRVAPRRPARFPSVSIVVPAYGRPEGTRATVRSLLDLEYPKQQLEIIVVDDASPEPLVLDDLPGVRVVRQATNGGPAIARNTGIAESSGELIGFLDNDCTADPDWLALLVATLEEPKVDLAGGRALAPPERSGILAAYEAARSPLDMGKARSAVGLGQTVPYVPSCNLVVRRSTALALEGFRAGMHLGEDVDFVWRAQERSRIVYEPAATVVHHHRERLFSMLRRRADYASSEARLAQLHPRSRRVLIVPVTALLALGPLVDGRFGLAPLAVASALVAAEVIAKRRQLRALGLPERDVLPAVLRAHGASLFHLSAALSRYYGIPLLLAFVACGKLRLVITALLFTYPIVDSRIRRAELFLPIYVALYTLEMAAYSLGVAWGHVVHRAFALPRVRLRR